MECWYFFMRICLVFLLQTQLHLVIDIILKYRPHVTKISVTSILKVEPGSWSTFIDTYTTIN